MKKMISEYIRDRLKTLILLVVLALVSSTIYLLYGLSILGVAYTMLVSAFVALCMAIYDFSGYYRKYRQIARIGDMLPELLEMQLPQKATGLEKLYQTKLKQFDSAARAVQKRLEQVTEEIKVYYSMWAHQIKTPLAAMDLILQAESANMLAIPLRRELFYANEYVDMLLHYVRIEQMSADLLIEPVSVDKMVRQVVRKFADIFIHKRLAIDLGDLNAFVLTDEKWFLFALDQFVSNALKYTSKGGIRIFVKQKQKQSLVIEDTGIGIREEDLPRIFEQGFTGRNGRFDQKSSGLGLYMCKQTLDKLRHPFTIASIAGQGSRVEIELTR